MAYTENDWRAYELYHHGILGMHWGVQNGPPYPLDSSISTGKRLKGSGSGNKPSMFDKMRKGYYEQQIQYLSGPRYRGETDNEYKMRMKQIDTFQKELDRINGKSSSGRVDLSKSNPLGSNPGREDSVRREIVSQVSTCLKNKNGRKEIANQMPAVLDEIRNSKNLEESTNEMKALGKEYQDYLNSDDSDYYRTLAGMVEYEVDKNSKWASGLTKDDWVYGYKYEDADQGRGNSYSLFLLDNGIDGNKYDAHAWSISKEYIDNLNKATKAYMGDRAETKVRDATYGKEYTVSSVLADTIQSQNFHTREWFGPPVDDCSFGDASATEIYRRLLADAKDEYARNRRHYDEI